MVINISNEKLIELSVSKMEHITLQNAAVIINELCDVEISADNILGFLESKELVLFDDVDNANLVSDYTSNGFVLSNCKKCREPYLITHRCIFLLIENLESVKSCISNDSVKIYNLIGKVQIGV